MTKAERTKAFVIEKSALLFNLQGYQATSLSDVMEATGLSKGSIYGNFENKDDLAVAVYKYNFGLVAKRLSELMRAQRTAKDQLKAMINFYRTDWKIIFERGGCPLLNASVEANDGLSCLKAPVQQSIEKWAADLIVIIDRGKREGEFKPDIDSTFYAYAIISDLEGAMMISKTMQRQDLLFSGLDRIDTMIDREMKL